MEHRNIELTPITVGHDDEICQNVLPIIIEQGEKKRQYLAALATTIGAFSIGTALAWTSPAIPILASNNTLLDGPISQEDAGWIGSLVAIGAIAGSIPTGYIADSIGRKWTILFMNVPFILSWLLIIFGRSIWYIYVARVLSGISCGGFSVVSPMYIGEIAEVSVRGTLGSYFEVLMCIGILIAYLVGAIVSYVWLAVLMCIPPVLCFVIFLFMPDTPVYYLNTSREGDAKRTLQYFRGVKYDINPEVAMLKKEILEAENNSGSLKDLISSRANINALIVALGLMFFQQMTGVNIVIFYTAEIFQAAGSDLHPNLCAVIIGIVQAIVTYISLLLVDKAGRKVLLYYSSTCSFICLIVLGAYFHVLQNYHETTTHIGWLPLLTLSIFIVGMAIGFGPIPWIVMGEVFSSKIKGVGSSLTCIVNWFLVFFVTKTYVNLANLLGVAGTYWFYAGLTGFGIVFIYFKVPETKGKSFLEIQGFLASR